MREMEIVMMADDGTEQVLTRTVPNKYSKRWQHVRAIAAITVGTPLEEATDNPYGLTFAVRSPFRHVVIGVRERE